MPCHAAVTDKMLIVSPGDEVETILKRMKKDKTDAAAVVDDAGKVIGVFSMRGLLKNLLPVSIAMNDGVQLDIKVGAAPGIAKRLKKVYPLKVEDVMERKLAAVSPDTPLWEGINLLAQNGGPLLVMDGKNNKPVGFMTAQSALDELDRLKDSET